MKKRNTYKLIIVLILIGLIACQNPPQSGVEQAPPAVKTEDVRGFDPLELARDKENIPKKQPRTGNIIGSATLVESDDDKDTDVKQVVDLPLPTDTVQSQVYRVQLLTSKVYSQARHAVTVAEEIFDQFIYLDYEVPYYKVRVGDFGTREVAEEYQMNAKAAGYSSCWVVVVNVGVKEAPLLYNDLPEMPVIDSSDVEQSLESEETDDFR